MFTLTQGDKHAVAYGMDLSQKAEGIGFAPEVSACLAPGTHPGHGNHVAQRVLFEPRSHDGVPRIHESEIVPTLNTAQGGQRQPCIAFVDNPPGYCLDRASFNQGENALYDFQITEDDTAHTLVARGPSAVAMAPHYTVRRLTPTECLRLQGFPDWWFDELPGYSDTRGYMGCGNSVAVPCVSWLIGRIAAYLVG